MYSDLIKILYLRILRLTVQNIVDETITSQVLPNDLWPYVFEHALKLLDKKKAYIK